MDVSMQELISAGAHFGHQSRYWNPKMKKYIAATYNHIHIINLEHTLTGLRKACEFVHNLAKNRNKLLLVGTKRAAGDIIKEQAISINQYYVNHRWMGGMLTNYKTVCSSIDKLKEFTKQSQDNSWNMITKKEALSRKNLMIKLEKSIGGIKDMDGLPDALFVIDIRHEHIAVMEAKTLGIPVIAIVDTNSNPESANYVIPGNDDSTRAIKLYVSTIVSAFSDGMKVADELSMKRKTKPEKPTEERLPRAEGTLMRSKEKIKETPASQVVEKPQQKVSITGINPTKVKTLRQKTGAGIMECKEMLQQAEGDLDAAIDLLRKSGRVKALKKTGRETSEGLFIAKVSDDKSYASLGEIKCETDFVARNEELINFGEKLIEESHKRRTQSAADILTQDSPLEEEFQQLVQKIGENVQIGDFVHLDAPNGGTVSAYVHNNNRVACLVAIDKDDTEICHDLALQVAAMDPLAAKPELIPQSVLAKEEEIYREQTKELDKPPEVKEKMIKGMIQKFIAAAALSEQAFIKDTQMKVSNLLKQAGVKEVSFIRRELGQKDSSTS